MKGYKTDPGSKKSDDQEAGSHFKYENLTTSWVENLKCARKVESPKSESLTIR